MGLWDGLTSAFRKKSPKRLLGPVNFDGVARRPAAASAPAFPRFRSTSADQVDPKLADGPADARIRLRDAFTPSQPVTDRRRFAGRVEMLTSLISAIEDQRLHVIIFGERGIGKTSLLHVLTQVAQEARYLVVYVSGGAESNFDEMFRAIAGRIPLLFDSGYGPTSAEAERGSTLSELLPSGPISVRIATDMLAKVTGTRVLVVLDEFDRCESPEFRRNIAELLKALSDRSVRVQVVIAGVAANLTELVDFVPSIQRNIFALQAPRMSAAEVRRLIGNGEETTGLVFEETAIAHIIEVASGLPYFASLLGHHAGLIAMNDNRATVTAADVAAAILAILRDLEGRLSKRAQGKIAACLSRFSSESLGAVASAAQSSGGAFTVDDIGALVLGHGKLESRQRFVDELRAEGMLVEHGREWDGRATYRFAEDSAPPYLLFLSFLSSLTAKGRAGRLDLGPGATSMAE